MPLVVDEPIRITGETVSLRDRPCDDFTNIRGTILLQTAQNVASLVNMLR